MRNIIVGGLFFVGGIIVTAVTYTSASEGGSYVVAWGAIIFGGIQMVRGFFQLGTEDHDDGRQYPPEPPD